MKNVKQLLMRLLLISVMSGCLITSLSASNYYWIGGTGNWSNGSHWSATSGGSACSCVPTLNDNVFFDANSFTIVGSQVTIDVIAYCNNMNWTGATNTPYLTSGNSNQPLYIYGSLTFIAGMNISSFAGNVYFESANGGQTITSAGQQFVTNSSTGYTGNIYFDGIGSYTLQDAFSTAGTIYLDAGQLNFNSKNVTAAGFNSSTNNVRNLIMGSSAVTITGSGYAWYCTTSNLSLGAGTSVITFTYSNGPYFAGGAQIYNNLNFIMTTSYSTITDANNTFNNVSFSGGGGFISGANNGFNKVNFGSDGEIQSGGNSFSKITFASTGEITGNNTADSVIFSAGQAYTIGSGSIFTINKYLQANGDCGSWIDIRSGTVGTQGTISSASAGGITVDYVRMKDIKATGGAAFVANNAVDFGDNTGWTMNDIAAKNLYWIGNTGNWNDPAHWSITSGGTSSGCIPTIYDNVYFDANSFTIFGSQVTIYVANLQEDVAAYCKNMDWTGATNNPYLSSSTSNGPLYIYGSLTFIAGMNISSFAGNVYFESANGGQTITSAGQQFVTNSSTGYTGNIYFDGIGSYTLQDAFSTAGTIYLDAGQLNFNSKNVTAAGFNSSTNNVRNLIMGSSAVTITGSGYAWYCTTSNLSLGAGTSVITFTYSNGPYFAGGAQIYNNLNFIMATSYSTITDANNTFNNVSFSGGGGFISGANNGFNKVNFGSDGEIQSGGNSFSKITFASTGEITGNNTADSVIFSAGQAYTIGSGSIFTINKYLQANGDCGFWIDIRSGTVGTQGTISSASAGGITVDYVRMKDIKATGGAAFVANNAVDFGDNTGWTMNDIAAKNLYWVGNTGNWDDGTHWSTTSGGTGSGCIPTIYDSVFFDANSFTIFGPQVNIYGANTQEDVAAYCKNMDWTGATNNPYLTSSTSNDPLYIYGSLTFISAMNIASFSGNVYFESDSSGQTITSAGKQFVTNSSTGYTGNIYFDGAGSYTMQDAFSTAGAIYLDAGQLNFNSKNVTAVGFNSSTSNVRNLIMGSSAVTITGSGYAWYCTASNLSLGAGASVITFTYSNGPYFAGGSQIYNNLIFDMTTSYSTITDANNTFNNVSFSGGGGFISGANNSFNKVTFGDDGEIQSGGNSFSKITFESTGTISGNNIADSVIFTVGQTYTLNYGITLTINNYLQAVGNASSYITIHSNSGGSQAFINKTTGNVCADYLNLQDLNAEGEAGFFAGSHSVNISDNTGWFWCSCSDAPSAAGTITGTATVCQGQNAVMYNVSSISGATSYTWTLPSGATGTSTTNSISVDYGTSAISGNVTVKGTNTCGNGLPSTFPVTVNPLPSAAGTIIGITPICQEQDSIIYSVPAIANASTYIWTLPAGATGTSTTDSITVNFGASAASGNITVNGNNSCGDGAISTLAATVNTLPPTPVITLNVSTLQSNAASGNQWYYQNTLIGGAIGQDYVPALNGNYYDIVTINGCSSDTSNVIDLLNVGINEISSINNILIYPNPAVDQITIENPSFAKDQTIFVYDVQGQFLIQQPLLQAKTNIDISTLAGGIYYIKVKTEKGTFVRKFVKE